MRRPKGWSVKKPTKKPKRPVRAKRGARSLKRVVRRRRCADCDALLSPYELGPVCASCKVERDDPEEPRGPSAASAPLGCPFCGGHLLVSVLRLVPMLHCNQCGAEAPQATWNNRDLAIVHPLKQAEYWAIKDSELCRPGSERWMVHDYRRMIFAEAVSRVVPKPPNAADQRPGHTSGQDCK